MAATNALLALGGMTQHCRRWGWRMFFKRPPDRRVAGTIDNVEFHDLFLQQPQGPAWASLGRLGTSQGNQFGFFLTVENPCNRRRRPLLTAEPRLEAFLRQLLPHPVNHGCAGLQRLDDPAVT